MPRNEEWQRRPGRHPSRPRSGEGEGDANTSARPVKNFAARPEPPAACFSTPDSGYKQKMVARWLFGVIALLAVVAVIFLAVSAMLDGGGG